MIIETLLDWLETAFNWIADLFPTTDFDPFSYVVDALQYVGDLNYFLPIGELAAAVLAVVILFPVFMGTTLFIWLVALVRGGSARG